VGLSAPLTRMIPPQATSGLVGPGAQRETARNITTSIPIQEKDKGPDEGDILNCAVSWTRDLMWMLHLKLQQQEDLAKVIADLGGTFPFKETEDERWIHTELMEVMAKNDGSKFHSDGIHKTPRAVYETTTASKELTANNELAKSIANSPTNSERSLPSSQQPIKVRKASTVSTYLFKLMKKDTEIIEAASNGDTARVAKLIGRGADVNTRDRWGVSHLF
jgi:hypothetical protein